MDSHLDNTSSTSALSLNAAKTTGSILYGRFGFLTEKTSYAVPVVTILTIASLAGTFGNILILIVATSTKISRNVEATFIVNLALSDFYVTIVADPMSLIGMLIFFGSFYLARFFNFTYTHGKI